jgi:hypothetical protein
MPDIREEPIQDEELKKLANIATDTHLDKKIRTQAINLLGDMDTHEALVALLSLAANEKNITEDRELALKRARDIVKKGR